MSSHVIRRRLGGTSDQGGGGGGGGCIAGCNAAVFDGTNDYASLTPTNWTDSKVGTVSFWFKLNGGDGVAQRFYATASLGFSIVKQGGNKIQILGKNVATTNILRMRSTTLYTADATWHHLIASWDLAATTAWMYIDGADEKDAAQPPIITNDTVNIADTNDWIGTTLSETDRLNASLSEFWFGNEFVADTVGNREKWRDATGEPVALGADGSTPTGSSPIYYLNNGGDSFVTNKGTGSDLVVGGALGDADGPGV